MRIRNSLMATAVILGLGFAGQTWAQQTNNESGDGDDSLSATDNSVGRNRHFGSDSFSIFDRGDFSAAASGNRRNVDDRING